jgi:hypothetical protein
MLLSDHWIVIDALGSIETRSESQKTVGTENGACCPPGLRAASAVIGPAFVLIFFKICSLKHRQPFQERL